jgi:hypothetical protein
MTRPYRLAAAASVLLALGAGGASATQLVVVEARGIHLEPGTELDGAKPLSLQDGQQVTLLAQSGEIVKIEGPSEAAPDSKLKAGGGSQASAVTALLSERQARTSDVGVVRGAKDVILPSPWVVDVTHPGMSCIVPGHSLVLWRSGDLSDSQVALSPADRSWTVAGKWPAGTDQLSMPSNLPLRDQTSYVVDVGGKLAPVTLRLIPGSVSNDVMRAGWMTEVGCDNQANALLAMLKK